MWKTENNAKPAAKTAVLKSLVRLSNIWFRSSDNSSSFSRSY